MKLKIISLLIIMSFCSGISAQIKVLSDGKVGIGNNSSDPVYPIDLYGRTVIHFPSCSSSVNINGGTGSSWGWDLKSTVQYTGFIGYYGCLYGLESKYVYATYFTLSDSRLKSNVQEMKDALAIIHKLRPVYFDYNFDYSKVENEQLKTKMVNNDKNRLGFIAQEVQEILPQSVTKSESDSMLCIQYDDFIPLLVKGMQEQAAVINSLKTEIETLKAEIYGTKKSDNPIPENSGAILYQNIPNPFSVNTTINCFIPESVANAKLMVFDLQGNFKISFDLSGRNNTSVKIMGSELKAGMYIYSLIIDGKENDTKRMILTE